MEDVKVRRDGRNGNAVIEVALLAPWIFFLFVGIFDLGFFCYAGICTQNAARAVAMSASQSSLFAPSACVVALGELSMLPNVNGGTCTSLPVQVTVTTLNGASCADSSTASGTAYAASPFCVESAVTYQTIPMLPIPGVLMGRMTMTRKAQMRILQ
jgi:Flp pilus assembly protein TadG